MFKLILLELKQLFRQLILCFIILISIYSVVFSTYAFCTQGLSQVITSINDIYSNRLKLDLNDVDENKFEQISKFGITNVWYEIDRVKRLSADTYLYINQEHQLSYEEAKAKFIFFERPIVSFLDDTLIELDDFTYNSLSRNISENQFEVWVSQEFCNKYQLQVGQTIKYIVSGDKEYNLIISKIFKDEFKINTVYNADVLLPMSIAVDTCIIKDIPVSFLAHGYLKEFSKYPTLFEYCDKNGIGISGIGEVKVMLEIVNIVQVVCVGIVIILILCSIFTLFNLLKMILNNRSSYVILLETLGCSISKIVMAYLSILSVINFISMSYGFIISGFINKRIAEILIKVMDIEYFELHSSISHYLLQYTIAQALLLMISAIFLRQMKMKNSIIIYYKEK